MFTHIDKTPGSKLTYGVGWADWLTQEGRTIEESTWELDEDITSEGEDLLDSETEILSPGTTVPESLAVVRLSGGTIGETYRCKNHVLLDNEDEEEATIIIKIVDK